LEIVCYRWAEWRRAITLFIAHKKANINNY
jgi:hypothetical protein